jgi:cytochrome o ubiquinol oxidase operon protein cyoD
MTHPAATDAADAPGEGRMEEAPGDATDLRTGFWKYTGALALSVVLTLVAFWVSGTGVIWPGGVPVMLAALAIGQMGVHLVLFLHVSSGPEGTNTILALAFGVFVVALVVFGSLVIMGSLDGMLPSRP